MAHSLRCTSRLRRALASLAIVAVALIAITADARAADYQDFLKARPTIQTKLKGRQPAQRLEAIRELNDYAFEDSAKLLIQYGLNDEAPENRRAAYDTLMSINRSQEVCDLLVEQLNIEAKRTTPDPNSPILMAVLLNSKLMNIHVSCQRFIDERLAEVKDGGVFLASVCDALASHGERGDVPALVKIATTKMFQQQFLVRRAVIQALTAVAHSDAVEAMITLLPTIEGEARGDIVEQLALVTGEKLTSDKQWSDWWKQHRETFVFPKLPPRAPGRPLANLDSYSSGHYYGLPLYAQRMVFVLDASGSMQGPRLDAAKRELITAIQGIKSRTYFGVLVFNDIVGAWRKDLVEATTANKADAIHFVQSINAGNHTSSYDALEAAFRFDAESIYFLSDGAPTSGKIVNPVDIVTAITKQNRARRESIYTLGIAPPGPEGSDFERFLSTLAEANYGVYRRVDQ